MLEYLFDSKKELEYSWIGFFILFNFFISSLLLGISYFLIPQNPYKEKISAYECGFEPFEDARSKFDVRFYIVAILFLVFDIEVIFLFPWSIAFNSLNTTAFWAMFFFLFVLILGFFYEIYKNALTWQ
jgi:NADH-quinone oxidoreductase subunit A